jgi:aminoacrylate hydrolase
MPILQTRGARIHYSRTGSGPAVLLIQGVGLIGNGWKPQVDGLQGEFTLFTFDNRGIGASTMLDDALSIEQMAADALSIMDAERIDRFHVVGHSMGGVIAQEVALLAPSRILSLSLLCTFVVGADATSLTAGMIWLGLRTRIGTRAMRRRAFLEIVMPAVYLERTDAATMAADLAQLFGHDLADHPPIVMRQLKATSRYDARPRLAELGRIPTLVVSAEYDRIARLPTGRALAAAIPGARFVEVKDAGHGVPIQMADEVNQLLREQFSKWKAREARE